MRCGWRARSVKQPGHGAAADRPRAGLRAPRCASTSRKMFWPNWKSASGAAASSATTTCSAGWPTRCEADDSPAQVRMHQRWPIVMVDEFQDTDPVQWKVIDRAFTGRSTLILIGDPKQAIYAFRGGDIVTYLKAAEDRGRRERRSARTGAVTPRWSTGCRWCWAARNSATPRIVVHDVEAHHQGHAARGRAAQRPVPAARGAARDVRPQRNSESSDRRSARRTSPRDLAADIGALLASGATFDGEPLRGPRHRGDRREPQGRRAPATGRCATRASRRCTPATPTSSTPTPPRTGCACWRRSTSRTARAWCAPPRRRCSSARPPKPLSRAATR